LESYSCTGDVDQQIKMLAFFADEV
jgi:hypothetical protein